MIGHIISHYKILEKLGEGGMGVVYKAEDTKLKRFVALKFLPSELTRDTEANERFMQEAQAASALDHTNICNIHEIGESKPAPGEKGDEQLFIVMGFYEGESLKKKIEKGPLQIEEIVNIAEQVATGLNQAHKKNIIHCDIKPGNVMITSEQVAKIVDFGLARLTGQTQETNVSTDGTISYMSPEQILGETIDFRTDIWSFGVMLYEMVTGQLPFKGEYQQAVQYSIINENVEPVLKIRKDTPEILEKIVKKCLEKNPEQRYQNFEEILDDLQTVKKFIEHGGKLPFETKKKKKLVYGLIISLVVLFSIVFLLLFRKPGLQPVFSKITIGVMFFDNQTNDIKFDYLRKPLADMLITDLGQSKYLQTMSFPRMFDFLKSIGYENVEVIDATLGFELCQSAHTQFMILGSLTKSGNTFVINAQIYEVSSKKQMGAFRATGKGEDSILGHLIDDLTNQIQAGLKEKIGKVQRPLKSITELTTSSLEAYNYYLKGKEAIIRNYHQQAIAELLKAITIDSTFVEAYDALARQYYTIQEDEAALKITNRLKTIATISKKLSENKLNELYALEAHLKGDWDLEISYLKKMIKINPNNIEAHLDLGIVYYHYKMMYSEGIKEFQKVLKLDPNGIAHDNKLTYNVLGYAYLRKGDYKKSVAAFKKYVELLPNHPDPLDSLGEIYLFIGEYDRAIEIFKQALKIKPDYIASYFHLGKAFVEKGMLNRAQICFKEVLTFSTSETIRADVFYNLAYINFLKNDYDNALKACEQSLILDQNIIKTYWLKGFIQIEKGNLNQAQADASKMETIIKQKNLKHLNSYYFNLSGRLAFAKGDNKQALSDQERSVELSSLERTFFENELGIIYFLTGKLNSAIKTFLSVLKINPNFAQTHYMLGLVYEKKGKNEKAIEHYQRFLNVWKDGENNLPQKVDVSKKLKELLK